MARSRPIPPAPAAPPVRSGVARLGAAFGAAVAVGALAACTATPPAGPATVASTVTVTPTAPRSSVTPVSEAPIPPAGPVQEVPATSCPYIANQAAADAEGDRVGRVTQVTTNPPGCNFYFQYQLDRMVLQISVQNYPTQVGAYNAMVRLAEASAYPPIGVPDLIPGTDAVLFKTTFYPPDGNTDWACAFARNGHLVTVHTQQNNVSLNARDVAAQIADKF